MASSSNRNILTALNTATSQAQINFVNQKASQEFKPLPLGEIYFKNGEEKDAECFIHLNKEQTAQTLGLKDKFIWKPEPEIRFDHSSDASLSPSVDSFKVRHLLKFTTEEQILAWRPNQLSATIGLFFTPEVGFSTIALKPIKSGDLIGIFSGDTVLLPPDENFYTWGKKLM